MKQSTTKYIPVKQTALFFGFLQTGYNSYLWNIHVTRSWHPDNKWFSTYKKLSFPLHVWIIANLTIWLESALRIYQIECISSLFWGRWCANIDVNRDVVVTSSSFHHLTSAIQHRNQVGSIFCLQSPFCFMLFIKFEWVLFPQHCVCFKWRLLALLFTWSFSSPSITPQSAGHQALHTCSFHHVIFSLMETLTKAPTVQSAYAAAIKTCKSIQSIVILHKIQRDMMAFVHHQ